MIPRSRLLLVPVVLTMTVAAARADVDKSKLRALVRLPRLSGICSFNFSSADGYSLTTGSTISQETPESIRKTLHGDDADAKRYYLLGYALNRNNPAEAHKAWQRSLDLYRKQLQRTPHDGERLAGLVQVLNALDRKTERDATLASALKLEPKNPEVWATRISVEAETAMAAAFGPAIARSLTSYDIQSISTLLAVPSQPRPSAVQVQKARRLLQQAKDDYDKAVTMAPKIAYIYASRACFATIYRLDMEMLDTALQQAPVTPEMLAAIRNDAVHTMFEPVFTNDIVTAGRLSRDEPFAIGMAAYAAINAEMSRKSPQEISSNKDVTLKILSAQTQQIVKEALARLETMSRASDKRLAGRSVMAMGILKLMTQTPAEAVAALRQAHASLPDDPRAVDALALAYAKAKRWADQNAMLTQALKTRENTLWRLALIKADEHQDRWAEAEQNVRLILQHDPQNLDANLMLAALLLRAATDEAHLQSAAEQLKKASDLSPTSPSEDQTFSFIYLRSIYLALTGDTIEAFSGLEQLQQNADDEQANDIKAILALLTAR